MPPAPVMPSRIGPAVRLGGSALALAIVAATVDVGDMLARLAGADPLWLVAALAALTLQTIVSAARWRLTAGRLGQSIGLPRAVSEYYIGQLVNQALPGGVLGDVGRAVRSRHQAGWLRAGHAVALERLAGQVALVAVAMTAIAATALVPGGVAWPAGTVPALGAIAAVFLAVGAAARPLRAKLPQRLVALAADSWDALAAPEVRWRQTALSLAAVACNIAAFAACGWATGTHLAPAAAIALVPLILLAMLIPIGVSGWGYREGAASVLWPLAGASPEAGVAASVAFGATLFVASLPGLVPLLAHAAGRPHHT